MKRTDMSFLEKFNGKMSKMGKQGITGLLNGSEPYVSAPQAATASEATKRPSIYRNKPMTNPTLSIADQRHQVNLDSLIPSNPKLKLPPKPPSVENRKLSNIARSEYVPSFAKQRSRNHESLEPFVKEDRHQRPHKTLQTPLIDSRYQRTRESIISVKTTDPPKNKVTDGYGLSSYFSNRQQKTFGFTNKMQDDVARHLEFLNSVEKKLTAKS